MKNCPHIDSTLECRSGDVEHEIRSYGGDLLTEIKEFTTMFAINSFEDLEEEPINDISKIDYKNIIVAGEVSLLFKNLPGFEESTEENSIKSLIKIGTISDKSIYVYPYLRYRDKTIICFNEPFCNYKQTEINKFIFTHIETDKKLYVLNG